MVIFIFPLFETTAVCKAGEMLKWKRKAEEEVLQLTGTRAGYKG